MKIGVFDSGVGGLSVARAIEKALPEHEVLFVNDTEHVPYGTRGLDEIYAFTKPILEGLVTQGCDVLVVACNTVSTNFAERLRAEINIPLIAMEPMVKPAAAASATKKITVCATPRTLESKRYAWLKQEFAVGVEVFEPDCSDWSHMIEQNTVDRQKIAEIVEQSCAFGSDQLVLGCTHYHWIEDMILELVNKRAVVWQPEEAVVGQLTKVLAQLQ